MNRRILFFTALNFWSISQGKGAPSMYNTINGYVQAGWEVHVVMRVAHPNFGSCPENLHLYNFHFPVLEKLAQVRHLSVLFRLIIWLISTARFIRIGSRIIRTQNIDVIYGYESDGVPAARSLAQRYRKPLVTRFMGVTYIQNALHLCSVEKINGRLRAKGFANKLRYIKFKVALLNQFQALKTKADLLIMTNDGTQGLSVLQDLGNQTSDIRYWINGVNAIDLTDFDEIQTRDSLGVPHKSKILMCVSRLVWVKRVDRSLRAFRLVLDQYDDDLCLVIVGEGEQKQDLMKLANKLGIGEKVIFTGGLPQSRVYQTMKLADIFLSLYDLSNMGNPLFEAMRVGRPIVTLDNGDTGTIIEHGVNGLLLPSDSSDETITGAILSVLEDPALAVRLGENASSYAKSHFRTWPERIAEEVELVSRLAKSRR